MVAQAEKAECEVTVVDDRLLIRLSGRWLLGDRFPDFLSLIPDEKALERVEIFAFETEALAAWDSGLLTYLLKIMEYCRSRELSYDEFSLPSDLRKIIALSIAVPEKEDARRAVVKPPFFQMLGEKSIAVWSEGLVFLSFTGECVVSLWNLLSRKTHIRWRDLWLIIQDCGVGALPIVALISFLIGLIIAFLGAAVLLRFGASYYVSLLVGYGMLREMGAVMAGIIMAGRTGAAFAAQIGSMKVSEEIDALKTFGISPIDFIVLPRMLALFLMMPILTVYADIIGIFGGFLVSKLMLDISVQQFIQGMVDVVSEKDVLLGVVKGTVFGVIVAFSGCLRGMQCGNSADAVGVATTSAVVTGITMIIFSNAVIDWIALIYGI